MCHYFGHCITVQDSGIATPVTLRVDKFGFYLHWVDQHNEMEMLDIAIIRDTRTGRHAKVPKVLNFISYEYNYNTLHCFCY